MLIAADDRKVSLLTQLGMLVVFERVGHLIQFQAFSIYMLQSALEALNLTWSSRSWLDAHCSFCTAANIWLRRWCCSASHRVHYLGRYCTVLYTARCSTLSRNIRSTLIIMLATCSCFCEYLWMHDQRNNQNTDACAHWQPTRLL